MITANEALKNLQTAIKLSYNEPKNSFAALEALSAVTGKTKTKLLADSREPLTRKDLTALSKLLGRIAKMEPLPYLLGYTQFYGNTFKVSKDVLIPRPETETLVEVAVANLVAKALTSKQKLNVLDIGTGSGAIIISMANVCSNLLANHGQISFFAVDISKSALRIAQNNASSIISDPGWLEQLHFIHTDYYPKKPSVFDVITANLPYLSADEYKSLEAHIKKYEPKSALFGGKTGTEIVSKMLVKLKRHLAPRGVATIELPPAHSKWLIDRCSSLALNSQKMDHLGFIWSITATTASPHRPQA